MRNIKIKKVLNGFRVKVGCQPLVFVDKETLMAELSRYIDNPDAVEKEYLAKYKSVKYQDTTVILENDYGQARFFCNDISRTSAAPKHDAQVQN